MHSCQAEEMLVLWGARIKNIRTSMAPSGNLHIFIDGSINVQVSLWFRHFYLHGPTYATICLVVPHLIK